VDSRDEVAEENESNNTKRTDIRVDRPQPEGQSDLYISEFSLDPPTPVQGRPVTVRIGVYNRGTAPSDACLLEWWAGSTFTRPTNTWRVAGLPARGGRIFTYTYPGYRSWYANLMTKAAIDVRDEVSEEQENNNESSMRIRVVQP
jgi:subtilase family serine protease